MYKFIYNKSTWRNEEYHFHIDLDVSITHSSIVKGWFVNKSDENYNVQVIDQSGNTIEVVDYLKNRPRLVTLYPEIKNVNDSGFEVITEKFCSNLNYFIAIFKGKEFVTKVFSFVKTVPLLYVHIPKTAGSTVNKVLNECFGRGQSLVHAESNTHWKELAQQQKINFLSGHIPYQAFINVAELQCYKKAITFREPYSHVISHLSWIRALSLAENRARYEAHPEYIQKLSDKLASYDFVDAVQISDAIQQLNSLEHRLLDNTQTRYIRTNLAKETVDDSDLVAAIENLKSFDFVGIDSNIIGFLSEIAVDYGFEYKSEDRRENVLYNKFGLDSAGSGVKEALLPLVEFDLQLYRAVMINYT